MRLSGVLVYAPPDIRDIYSPSRWEIWLLQMRQRLQTPLRKPADVEANQPVSTGCNCLETGLAILPADRSGIVREKPSEDAYTCYAHAITADPAVSLFTNAFTKPPHGVLHGRAESYA